MNLLEELADHIRHRLPAAEVTLDPPARDGGTWWLDARLGDRSVVVEWRPALGFGVSVNPSEGYGEGPDEVYKDADDVLLRVLNVLDTGAGEKLVSELAVRRLRYGYG